MVGSRSIYWWGTDRLYLWGMGEFLMKIICYDMESFWSSKNYSLSRMGPLEYIRDAQFDPFMLCMATNNDDAFLTDGAWSGVPALLSQIDQANDVLVAHNGGGFDHLILSEHFGMRPQHMWDTIWMMRWCGLSSICRETHAALTDKLGNGEKKPGTVVSDNKHWPHDFTREEQEFFKQYCRDDTTQLRDNLRVMLPYMTSDCLRFMSLTARMATEPVFVLNQAMLEEYIRQLDEEAENARKTLMELFHFADLPSFFTALRSADKFADMLRTLGVEPPKKLSEKKTATAAAKLEAAGDTTAALALKQEGVYTYAFSKSDVEFLALLEHEDPRVRLLVETRLEFNSSIMRSRAETFLKFAKHNRPIPIMLSAFQAHTSRYTAGATESHNTDRLQFQNLAKRNPAFLPLRKAIQVPQGMRVVAVDSSQIELRVNAWMAGQQDLLQAFRDGRDPYAELASSFDRQYTAQQIHDGAKSGDKHCKLLRNTSKMIQLGCGYGTSAARAARAMWVSNVRLHENYDTHAEQAGQYHALYRQSNAAIVYFWKTCQRVIEHLAMGGSGSFGGSNDSLFRYGVMDVVGRFPVPSIMLPSGFALRYPNLRAIEGEQKIEYVYDRQRGKNITMERLYGSRLDENLCQSLAFQILMWQACRMDEAGIRLKGNNHDCWFTVVPEKDAQSICDKMIAIMRQLPSWAQGLPLDAEGEISTDFSVC